jgi:hypothetical protein
MRKLLKKAFEEADKLSEVEQDAVAQWLLDELHSEQRWEAAFSRSHKRLGELAHEALTEHSKRRSKRLNLGAL